jgi:hypothetical protein
MNESGGSFTYCEKDGLRLLGISRISRCGSCERLASLMDAYRSREAVTLPLPPVPADCSFEFCAPVVDRFTRSTTLTAGGTSR